MSENQFDIIFLLSLCVVNPKLTYYENNPTIIS